MSSVQTQLAVASNAPNLVNSTQMQKDYLDDTLNRQNSLGNRGSRGNIKTKHLTRSHAMRESTSPPRTPTPRTDPAAYSPSSSEAISDTKMHVQSSSSQSTSPSSSGAAAADAAASTPATTTSTVNVIVTSQTHHHHSHGDNGVICNDADFPKLTPPKSSKNPRNSINRDMTNEQHTKTETTATATTMHPKGKGGGGGGGDQTKSTTSQGGGDHVHSNNSPQSSYNTNQSDAIYTASSVALSAQTSPLAAGAAISGDKEHRYPRNDSQNSNNSFSPDENQNNLTDSLNDSAKGDRLNQKKHRASANSKGSKPRLKTMGSSSSMDGGGGGGGNGMKTSTNTSGFISRGNDGSTEQFTDQSGVDLVQFFKETLNKNPMDRTMLMNIEKDLIELSQDKMKTDMRFPPTSSYNRMLIHRVAAFFGMEHNVDTETQQCVIVAPTKSTRIPDISFQTLIRDRLSDEPRKSILKRDAHSFDDSRQSYLCPDRGVLDRKAKSFEEREEEYHKARRRIFRNRENGEMTEEAYWHWSSTESSDHGHRMRQNKMMKSGDHRQDGRPSVSKSHSFGGYGGPPQCGGPPLARGNSVNSTKSVGPRMFSKQDSVGSSNTPWRLSPSSSGYKTQTQSLRSDSVTPSPTGYGSDDHTPEPSVVQSPPPSSCGVVWAVTDMASVPRGSVLINPQTLQPIVNQDGSIYRFDPSDLPPSQAIAPAMYNNSKHTSNNNNNNQLKKKTENSKMSRNDDPDENEECSTVDHATNTVECLTEALSECSVQTVVVTNYSAPDDTKENVEKREMDDIQEETTILNPIEDECEKASLKVQDISDEFYPDKPTLKHQATSPNIPSPEPEEPQQPETFIPVEADETKPNSTSSTPASTSDTTKKDEPHKSNGSNIPIMSFATTYQTIDGTTVFQQGNGGSYPATTYQQGADGNLYAVPQSMVYAYPQSMDGEVQGYFMPVYDPAQGRDPSGLMPAPGQTIYQPAAGPTVVPMAAYSSAPFGGAPIYQGPVVYSSDQFAAGSAGSAAAAGQYPVATYPIGYPYPYNGYWGQPIPYYVPPGLANAVPSSLLQPPGLSSVPATPNNHINMTPNAGHTLSNSGGGSGGHSHHHNGGNGTGRKRSTPPHQSLAGGQSRENTTPANTTYQFAPGVPVALASDLNGPTMYALPPAVFPPNMLPYAPQTTPTAASSSVALPPPPPPQSNAVINPLIGHHSSSSNGPMDTPPGAYTSAGGGGHTKSHNSSTNNSGTPQSAPSTPLSTSVSHNARNPPLFATPPMVTNGGGYTTHYSSYDNSSYSSSQLNYDKRNSVNGGGMNKKNNNNGNPNMYTPNSRPNSYSTQNQTNHPRKPHNNNSSPMDNNSTTNGNSNRSTHMSMQKRPPIDKPLVNSSGGQSISMISNGGGPNGEKPRTTAGGGYRQKPANLDFRKNGSQRNSPSTNSIESNNNSPNSIVSNHMGGNGGGGINYSSTGPTEYQHHSSMYMTTRGAAAHIPSMHHAQTASAAAAVAAAVAANDAACHQSLIGTYNHHNAAAGMYFKYGQTYFAHPTMALPNNRRSPPSDIRPSLAPLTGVYPTVNMMIPAPRQMQPRHPNPNYKGNKPAR